MFFPEILNFFYFLVQTIFDAPLAPAVGRPRFKHVQVRVALVLFCVHVYLEMLFEFISRLVCKHMLPYFYR